MSISRLTQNHGEAWNFWFWYEIHFQVHENGTKSTWWPISAMTKLTFPGKTYFSKAKLACCKGVDRPDACIPHSNMFFTFLGECYAGNLVQLVGRWVLPLWSNIRFAWRNVVPWKSKFSCCKASFAMANMDHCRAQTGMKVPGTCTLGPETKMKSEQASFSDCSHLSTSKEITVWTLTQTHASLSSSWCYVNIYSLSLWIQSSASNRCPLYWGCFARKLSAFWLDVKQCVHN